MFHFHEKLEKDTHSFHDQVRFISGTQGKFSTQTLINITSISWCVLFLKNKVFWFIQWMIYLN